MKIKTDEEMIDAIVKSMAEWNYAYLLKYAQECRRQDLINGSRESLIDSYRAEIEWKSEEDD